MGASSPGKGWEVGREGAQQADEGLPGAGELLCALREGLRALVATRDEAGRAKLADGLVDVLECLVLALGREVNT